MEHKHLHYLKMSCYIYGVSRSFYVSSVAQNWQTKNLLLRKPFFSCFSATMFNWLQSATTLLGATESYTVDLLMLHPEFSSLQPTITWSYHNQRGNEKYADVPPAILSTLSKAGWTSLSSWSCILPPNNGPISVENTASDQQRKTLT